MAKLIYAAITSLDGYIAGRGGWFEWGVPDEEVHAFVNDLERTIGTYLYGRRMYEVMVAWETMDRRTSPGRAGLRRDLAGRRQGRVLTTLEAVSSARTRLERASTPRRSGR